MQFAPTDYAGIDYGLGQSNIDTKTGIRFGLISANSLHEYFWEDVEAKYGQYCPDCGSDLPDDWEDEGTCPACGEGIVDGDQYGDEPDSQVINTGGVEGFVGSDNEVWVTKSPFYTHAQFCSPCMPGAGNLNHPCTDGPKTYCLPGEWFDDGEAPYPVYPVDAT